MPLFVPYRPRGVSSAAAKSVSINSDLVGSQEEPQATAAWISSLCLWAARMCCSS